jgi:hypothetical protein
MRQPRWRPGAHNSRQSEYTNISMEHPEQSHDSAAPSFDMLIGTESDAFHGTIRRKVLGFPDHQGLAGRHDDLAADRAQPIDR